MMKILFNPFIKIAGYNALIYGWLIILLTAVIAYFSNCHFDGAIDVHEGAKASWWFYYIEPLIDWISITFVLYLAGILFSQSKIRFFDVVRNVCIGTLSNVFCSVVLFWSIAQCRRIRQNQFFNGFKYDWYSDMYNLDDCFIF
ncbi:MAG TPA: hypothetical protein VMU83_14685 [Hanamia sp.]|nr:hypothetical protein [Hanamia sp.]